MTYNKSEISDHGALSVGQIKAHENEITEVLENHYGHTHHYYIRFSAGSVPHTVSRGQPYLAWTLPENLHTRITEQ